MGDEPPVRREDAVSRADSDRDFSGFWHRAGVRVGAMLSIFAVVAVVTGVAGSWVFAPAVGWIIAIGVYASWVWRSVVTLGPADTASHATREDPTQPVAQALLIAAGVASVGAIVLLLVEAGTTQGPARFGLAGAALGTVGASWLLVQIVFTLRYAGVYYRDGGTGVDFNQSEPPAYRDFAYVAFTLGMTYQVSDTDLTSTSIRREALRHAVLSYVLGVIVLAAAINLIAALIR
ncbi:DUF1345 domain-containing protein [Microbacterium sp. SLBN-146]|uniref:DUF1345 domain-containing protein n=1 Tax=Microbacterium sp. SLBN-146 TaxID=2768457 RepID=UPI00116C85FF|nr:DUF1345 domain-containing protein [Microbacterium sp. SLBN-146]TQJ31056.1 putative membrane protein [Microbacterium sp. SLBN-146]